jgi:hypothetical protein
MEFNLINYGIMTYTACVFPHIGQDRSQEANHKKRGLAGGAFPGCAWPDHTQSVHELSNRVCPALRVCDKPKKVHGGSATLQTLLIQAKDHSGRPAQQEIESHA